MIVKYLTDDKGWEFRYVKKFIKRRALTVEQYEHLINDCMGDPNMILNFYPSDEIKDKVVLIRVDELCIYTTSNVYLLNNEGKTIETLN